MEILEIIFRLSSLMTSFFKMPRQQRQHESQ